MSASLNVFI